MSSIIRDIAIEIGSGITPLRTNKLYWDSSDVPWVKTEQIGQYQIFDSNEYISTFAVTDTNIRLWPPHTVSVAMYGEGKTRGNVSILMIETTTNQACCNIIVNEAVADYRFLYYWLKRNYEKLRSLAAGVRKNLNSDDIKSFPFPDFKLSTQTQIADVLSTLDDKIQINSQICSELEAMAKTLYDYWFVQFDFPDGNGKPYRTSGGEMVWNEQLKRKIPKGWGAKHLSGICNFRNGINYEKGCVGNCTYRIANVRNITASSFLMDVSDFDEITLPKEQGSRYVLNKNDIIIARSGTPGATRLVIDPSNDVVFCGFIICCTPFNPKHRLFLAHFLKQLEGTNATKTGGSILQNVSQDTLKSLQVPLPNDSVLDCFNKKIEPLVQMMQNIINENHELTKLRDWLLPMLMNGQARVE